MQSSFDNDGDGKNRGFLPIANVQCISDHMPHPSEPAVYVCIFDLPAPCPFRKL